MLNIVIDKITKALTITLGNLNIVQLSPIKYTSDAGINISTSEYMKIAAPNNTTKDVPACGANTLFRALGIPLNQGETIEPFAHLEPGNVEYLISITNYDSGAGNNFFSYIVSNLYTARKLNNNEYISITAVQHDMYFYYVRVAYNLTTPVDIYMWFKLNSSVIDVTNPNMYNVQVFQRTLNNSSHLTENNGAYSAFIRRV